MREQHGQTMEGQSFGNYDLVRLIDGGGMGEVYLARQRTAFGREVAIKIIREELMYDVTARARFLREAQVNTHLKREHILTFIEFGEIKYGEKEGRLFFVTPYIEGGTLARRLRDGPLPLPVVHQLFSALLKAVNYIHSAGVVHRDLKPSNILLDQGSDGQVYVRLIDFGIARFRGEAANPPLTMAGHEVGTIAYMAPERLSGVAEPSNDIYSLGVILYEMLTGQLPPTPLAMSADAINRVPTFASTYAPFPVDEDGQPQKNLLPLPPPLEYVVRRCMAPVNVRFATAEDVLTAFEHAYHSVSMATRMLPAETSSNEPPLAASQIATDDGERAEVRALQPVGDMSLSAGTFVRADYEAPTTMVDATKMQRGGRVPRTRGRRGRPVLAIIPILIVVVLLAMAGILLLELQVATSVAIRFSAKTVLVSQIFQITAKTTVTKIDVASASIPATVLNKPSTDSRVGPTTGQSCVIFFGCKQVVAQNDVDTLAAKIRISLQSQIKQALQQQLQTSGATAVGPPEFMDIAPTPTADPPVGSQSQTVKVTLTEQGSLGYFLKSDARTLAQQLLQRQMQTFGPNYVPLASTIQIGPPVIAGVNTGVVTLNIAAGGYIEYKFPQQQLLDMQNHIKGVSLKSAQLYIMNQPGVDPQTVSIHFTAGSGDTLPGDPRQIKITPVDPTIPLSPVQLPNVTEQSTPGATVQATATPIPGPTPTATPTVKPTPTSTPTATPTPTPTPNT